MPEEVARGFKVRKGMGLPATQDLLVLALVSGQDAKGNVPSRNGDHDVPEKDKVQLTYRTL